VSLNLLQEFGPLIGVLVGGTLSTGTTMLLYSRQRRDAISTERRAREVTATSDIGDALLALLKLECRPDEPRDMEESRLLMQGKSLDGLTPEPEQASLDQWERKRGDILLWLERASLDLLSESLRSRLELVQRALRYPHGPWDIERQPESVTRRIVCQHALQCVGAFRRGDVLPAEPGPFINTVGDVAEWIGWQEEQDRYQREEWAKRRAIHKAAQRTTPAGDVPFVDTTATGSLAETDPDDE
jgi:hypothetical protein